MHFEQLPNELLLYIFESLNLTSLLCGFDNLNARFQTLLYHEFSLFSLDIASLYKRQLATICQQYLPRLTSRIIALKLTESDYRPGAVGLFFSHVPSLAEFTRLEALNISELHCHRTKTKLIEQLPSLLNLRHFRLSHYVDPLPGDPTDQLIVEHIWRLPKLISCNVHEGSRQRQQSPLQAPATLSSSLQSLFWFGRCPSWSTLDQLLQQTPSLRSLHVCIAYSDTENYIPSATFTQLVNLERLTFAVSAPVNLRRFLRSTPGLRSLNVTLSVIITGHAWEELVRAHLPALRTLRFSMQSYADGEDRLDSLVDTFRGPFWTVEHRWYVWCFYEWRALHLQTTSTAGCAPSWLSHQLFRSTDPQDTVQKLHQQLLYVDSEHFVHDTMRAGCHLPRLAHLLLTFPVDEQFGRVFAQFEQLISLTIYSYANQFAAELQSILDRSSRLEILSIEQQTSEPMDLSWLERVSTCISNLTLRGRPLTGEECRTLSRSSLGRRCRLLKLCVEQRENVLILVNNLPALRALHLLYDHVDEELMHWLREQLPTSCFISSCTYFAVAVRVWVS